MKNTMRNFKIEITNNNTFVIRADSARFGKNQIMFESYKKSECYEWAAQHGAKIMSCKNCGQLFMPTGNRQKFCKELNCMKDRGVFREFWYNGNFHSHEDEVSHMRELRNRGYNNREIAKMVGRSIQTIYDAIGKQPKIMTELSLKLAGEHKAKANHNRKIAIATAKREAYERLIAEQAQANAEKESLIAKLNSIQKTLDADKAEYENAMNVLRSA